MGALYKDNVVQPRSTKPWRTDFDHGFGSVGDIANFSTLTDMTKWKIGNTPASDAQKLQWHKVQDGNKTLFICDRVLLVRVSWDVLNAQGYVTGKTITIDGQPYLCRLLKGGANYRTGTDMYSGGTLPNEWDSYITNEQNIAGIPTPTAADLDTSFTTADRDSTHNRFWNWGGVWSCCQETYTGNSYRVLRGYYSARFWTSTSSSDVSSFNGWRPVLELLNSAPLISGSDSNLGGKSAAFSVNYSITDADNDAVTAKEYLDATLLRTYTPTLGASNTLTVTADKFAALTLGNHTVKIVANDGKASDVTRTHTFQKTDTLVKFVEKTVETEIAAKRITVSGLFTVPPGATLSVFAANNGYDTTPTWEDVTACVLSRDAYSFTNKAKTAAKWGIAVMVQIVKGTATTECNCRGFGYTFE